MDVSFKDGSNLIFPEQPLAKLRNVLATNGCDFESGGILLGSRESRTSRFIVKEMTFPSHLETRRRFLFVRSKHEANQAIKRAWTVSGGTVNYLGEWHTHNEKIPNPSCIDRSLINEVIADGVVPLGRIFMLIAGNSDELFVGMAALGDTKGFAEEKRAKWPA